jgi:hypothetical protein
MDRPMTTVVRINGELWWFLLRRPEGVENLTAPYSWHGSCGTKNGVMFRARGRDPQQVGDNLFGMAFGAI